MAPQRDLIVLESPNKIGEVRKYAEKFGLAAKVTATVGHLLDLPPMSTGPGVDTARFVAIRLEPRNADAGRRIGWLRGAIDEADRVIVATDPDREGEAIAAQVWQWIPPGKAWRATFEEITAAGVARGLAAMRPELNAAAVEAAATRRIVDRLAGWHATAVVFDKLRKHKGISAGRLQSAALRLVVERYREHESFRSTTTFGVRLRVRSAAGAEFSVALLDDDGAPKTFTDKSAAEAHSVPERLKVRSVEAEKKSQKPRPPFDAPSWLQVAQKALGLTVKDGKTPGQDAAVQEPAQLVRHEARQRAPVGLVEPLALEGRQMLLQDAVKRRPLRLPSGVAGRLERLCSRGTRGCARLHHPRSSATAPPPVRRRPPMARAGEPGVDPI